MPGEDEVDVITAVSGTGRGCTQTLFRAALSAVPRTRHGGLFLAFRHVKVVAFFATTAARFFAAAAARFFAAAAAAAWLFAAATARFRVC